MGRNFKSLMSTTPVATAYFQDLRDLKKSVRRSFKVMAAIVGLAPSTLSTAVSGSRVAPWETYESFLSALDVREPEVLEYWRERHAAAEAEVSPVIALPRSITPASAGAPRPGAGATVMPFKTLVLLPSPHISTAAEFMEWAEKVKYRSGMSFTDLADFTGIARATVALQFRRRTLPDWDVIAKIITACGITEADDLLMCRQVWNAVRDAETVRQRGGTPRLRSVDGPARDVR